MLKVESRVKCYEVDGTEPHAGGPDMSIKVHSHWNRQEFVVLEHLNGTRVTVLAADLQAAVGNAQNSGRR